MTPILILAAGQSSRMRGIDKLMELVDGEPLLSSVARQALGTGQPVFVAIPHVEHPRFKLVNTLKCTCLVVPESAEGLSGTIRGAIKQLPPCEAFMLMLADLPGIRSEDMQTVFAARKLYPENLIWRAVTANGKPGHPILFDASLRYKFEALSGDNGGEAILKEHMENAKLVPISGQRARADIDTPEDLASWCLKADNS